MAIYQLQDLRSWLKYLDDNYLTDENANLISQLDINILSEQRKIIEILIKPEFQEMDQTNKQNFYKILEIALNSEETKLNSVFDSMSFGYVGEVLDKVMLLKNIQSIIDAILFVNNKNINETIKFNFYTWTELIKAILIKYADKSKDEANTLISNSPIINNTLDDYMSAVVRCHESEYHLSMLIAYGEQYWLKGISSDEPDDYFEWEEKYRKEHNLAQESFEIINKIERFKNENN